ncbi:helicase-like transcription factor CHR28 [Argentina anserina]|uniref:helicase-like transcription factor CHR28 n=1 Tax=Argentina anserina TaxID=57926 RepID=UPI0021768ABC|nr:helicase-like transcription factor CHR28 [Potentilla anserina]XP_050368609.1 helicase-like transcription factor CHR28 [Potentilla anserina]
MLMAEDSSNWSEVPAVGAGGFAGNDLDDDEDMSMDIEAFYRLLEEDPTSLPEDSSLGGGLQGEAVCGGEDTQLQNGSQVLKVEPSADSVGPGSWHPSYSSEASESGVGGPGGSFDSAGNPVMLFDYRDSKPAAYTGSPGSWHPSYISEATTSVAGGLSGSFESGGNPPMEFDRIPPAQSGSPGNVYSPGLQDWISSVPYTETYFPERNGVSHPTCSTTSSFEEGLANHTIDQGDLNILQGKADVSGKVDFEYSSQSIGIDNMDMSSRRCTALRENTTETLGPSENNSCTSMEMPFLDVDICSPHVTSTESTLCQDSDLFSDHYTSTDGMSLDNTYLADSSLQPNPYNYYSTLYPSNKKMMTNVKDESVEFPTDRSCASSKININCQEGMAGSYGFDSTMIDASDITRWNFDYGTFYGTSAVSGNSSLDADSGPVDNKASIKPLGSTNTYVSRRQEFTGVKDESVNELGAPSSGMPHAFSFMEGSRKPSYNGDSSFFDNEPRLSGHVKEETKKTYFPEGNNSLSHISGGSVNLNGLEYQLPAAPPFASNKNQGYNMERPEANRSMPKSIGFPPSKVSPESIHSNFSEKSPAEDDCDVTIIEDISDPAPAHRLPVVSNNRYPASMNHPLAVGSNIVSSQQSNDHDTGVGGLRFRTRDEQLILRVALQDLSQPKSEALPPDGVLTVPLLRHQRIALSWMVQKETASLHCSGGILADDQGLGKTISTIALILKERPASGACQDEKKCKLETLDLDKDDDMLLEIGRTKQDDGAHSSVSNETSQKTLTQTKGRIACGTLVVCPTSVLRQWAEELHNKVTEKGKLSVLVYHGGNRTRDPSELAKYDVVLTTYSIVSMEVPKQPLADGEDGEKGKFEDHDSPHMGFFSKKRKYPDNSSKGKKKLDNAALESLARPLAKVGWFRVVLDEAQSIKNHRTQVARACWGLRAKRRWCLSGTPIQNAIDDLYSYFRFLRYDPYAVYKTFCATIKVPISKNPTKGYRKLQAVLKTIMLRRTKGTLLDGEPIINLPPKLIELKRVEFSDEERDFYSRLECDSRAQFEEYAAAGTVKQNYVNILLMLLRLRQACDHPLLVRRYESQSLWKSSIEKAQKLPHDKQVSLLNCLEASLAICGICNDAPEDAVVSECGHVFCSQCIGDYLTGDDNKCPNTSCKVRLNVSSVFSKATLNSSLSDQPSQRGMGSEVFDAVESFYEDSSYNSSKIKAALEVLCSMCKPKICATENSCLPDSVDNNASCSTTSDIDGVESLEGGVDGQNLDVDKSPKKVEKVVREKAIVFSQWTRMLDLLEVCLKTSGLEYRRLDGTMSVVARDKAVKDFNTLPEVTVMIMSLKAASLGLNMVAACHVLLLDLWWNPTTEDQAIDRAHRIGQTRPVTVLRLTVRDTVEDRILALQKKKREMVASAFGEDESGGRQTRLTVDDLKYLFMK